MSALDKIIEELLVQAGVQADEILDEAKEKVIEIYEKAQAARSEWQLNFDEYAENEYREIVSRAESADRQNRRRKLLEARNQVINEVIAEAKARIVTMPDEKYFDLLFHLFVKNAQPLDGVMRFAQADHGRIPEGFTQRCQSVFPDSSLSITESAEDFGYGFVIEYEGMLHDCTIDGIFQSSLQALRDAVYEALTAGQ